jgi:hypothetical protein
MKKFLFGAAAAAALVAPAVASADTNAVVGAQYTNIDFGSGSDADNYGLTGGFSHTFGNGTVLQMDGETGRVDAGGCCIALGYGAVHYGMRNDNHGVAGFLTLQDFFGYSGAGVGAEGQLFFSNAVLNGSLGYMDFNDLDVSATNVQVDGSWFFTPNFAVNANVAFTEFDASPDIEATTLGVGAEWRFDNSPASVIFGYRNSDSDDYGDSDTWTIGFNVDLGTGSLQERATSGSSFGGANAFHNALRSIIP